MKETLKELKETIEGFEGKEAQLYWINKLKVSDSIKGRLIIKMGLTT